MSTISHQAIPGKLYKLISASSADPHCGGVYFRRGHISLKEFTVLPQRIQGKPEFDIIKVPLDGVCVCIKLTEYPSGPLRRYHNDPVDIVRITFLYEETLLETSLEFWQQNFVPVQL